MSKHRLRTLAVAAAAIMAPAELSAQGCPTATLSQYLSPGFRCSLFGVQIRGFYGFGSGPNEVPAASVLVKPTSRMEYNGQWLGFDLTVPAGTGLRTTSSQNSMLRAGLFFQFTAPPNPLDLVVGGVSARLRGGTAWVTGNGQMRSAALVQVSGTGSDGIRRNLEQVDATLNGVGGETSGDRTRVYDYPNGNSRTVFLDPTAGDYFTEPDIDIAQTITVFAVLAGSGSVSTGAGFAGFEGGSAEFFIKRSQVVPEPSTLALLCATIPLLVSIGSRKRSRR